MPRAPSQGVAPDRALGLVVGDRHRAEEIFQEVFFTVWQKRKQYKFPKRFRSWLYAIAANRCRQDYRKSKLPTTSIDQTAELVSVGVGGFYAGLVGVAGQMKQLPIPLG